MAEISKDTRKILNGKRIGLVSLGCAKNTVDSEMMLGMMNRAGMTMTDDPQKADILLVNTCGFIGPAQKESVDNIISLAEYKEDDPSKKLVVTGCLVTRFITDLEESMPEVDKFIPLDDYPNLLARLAELYSAEPSSTTDSGFDQVFTSDYLKDRVLTAGTHSVYLKISEGCDHPCTFCSIPAIRGRFRSRTIDDILIEAESLARRGALEINLIAQDSTMYGLDIYKKQMLPELLRKLSEMDGLTWIRVLYAYPSLLTKPIIKALAETPKVVPYIDLPLQHIDEEMLKMTRRGLGEEPTRRLVDTIINEIPDLALRTTFIVGHPGETEAKFEKLRRFVEETPFEHVGVFTYSPEEGTPSAEMPNPVPEETAEERRNLLMSLQAGLSEERLKEKYVGKTLPVLVERISEIADDEHNLPITEGRTAFQAPETDGITILDCTEPVSPGTIVSAEIIDSSTYDLHGVIQDESTK